MWVRQRARIAERIERTRREYAAAMPEHTGPGIDVTTVAARRESGGSPLNSRNNTPSPVWVPAYFGSGCPSMIRNNAVR